MSQAFYSKTPSSSTSKIVFYDQFESTKEDIEGAVTSRFEAVETTGESLTSCRKVDDLIARFVGESKKKMGEGRCRKKEKKGNKMLKRLN